MPPKTERFEMRLDADLIDRIEDWKADQEDYLSRAEAIRQLIERGLGTRNISPTPNDSERLILWLLTEIAKRQMHPKGRQDLDEKSINLIQQVLYGGHFWALKWSMVGVLHDHADQEENVSTVVKILEMWTRIESAYAVFTDEDKKTLEKNVGVLGKNPRFMGFDGNNESEYMSIANFLVKEMGRFQSFQGRDFNSHMPTVNLYLEIYSKYEPMGNSLIGRELTVTEVCKLLERI